MRIIVTGGAGFIGQHTVKLLEKRGHDVLSLDNNFLALDVMTCHNKCYCDITNLSKLEEAFDDFIPDSVIHLAANSSVVRSLKYPHADADINIMGTINLLDICHRHGIKRIVYAGSAGTVYGNPKELPMKETMSPAPQSPYGITKLAGELYIKASGIPYAILRYGNVYGPGQPSGESGVVAIFVNNILKGIPSTIYGNCSRDYVFVKDVARANMMAVEAEGSFIVHIGSGGNTSTAEIYDIIAKEMNCSQPPVYAPARAGEVRDVWLDISEVRKILNWQPAFSLQDGIRETIKERSVICQVG